MMIWINILLLNALWFSCVLGAANGLLWPGIAVFALLVAINLQQKVWDRTDHLILLASLISGVLIDGSLQYSGLVDYQLRLINGIVLLPPIWIMILWAGFGLTLRTAMQWFLQNPLIGGIVLLIGAPLSYFSASKLGAVNLPQLWQAMGMIGVSWLIYFALMVYLTQNRRQKSNVTV